MVVHVLDIQVIRPGYFLFTLQEGEEVFKKFIVAADMEKAYVKLRELYP